MNRFSLIKIEDDIDDEVDVGYVDFPVAIDVGPLAYRVAQDVVDEGIDIGDVDLTVTVDIVGRPNRGVRQDVVEEGVDISDVDLVVTVHITLHLLKARDGIVAIE